LPSKQVNQKSDKYDPFKENIESVLITKPADEAAKEENIKSKDQNNNRKNNGKFNNNNKNENMTEMKPKVDKNQINDALRNYYKKNWKSCMEENLHFDISGLDALMASKGLEKSLYDRLKAKPLEYDACCASVSNTLRHVSQLKTISQKIRNESFQVDFILQYCDKPLWTLKGIEKNLNQENSKISSMPIGLNFDSQNSMLEKRHQDSFFMESFNINQNGTKKFQSGQQKNFKSGQQNNKRILKSQNNQSIGLLDKLSTNHNGIKNQQGNSSIFEPISHQLNFMKPENGVSVEEELPEEVEEICHYRIFNGSFQIELKEKSSKKNMPSIELMTCTSVDNLHNYSLLNNDVCLSTKVGQDEFEKYMNRIMSSSNDYNIIAGWLPPKKSHSAPLNYFKTNKCVASGQYSKCSKIFMLPTEFLQPSWLKQIPFYTSASQIELCFFLVLKLEEGPADIPLISESVALPSTKIYRVYFQQDQTKPSMIKSRIDHIKSTRGFYPDTFAQEEDVVEKNKGSAQKDKKNKQNKLEYLLDHADEYINNLNPNENMDDEIESYSPAIENELLENNQEPTKNLTEELGYNLSKPLVSSHFGLNTNTLGNFNKNSLASLPQIGNTSGIANTMTSQMNPNLNPFGNINMTTDLIETLRDPLQKHLHFGPNYSNNNENMNDSTGFLGKKNNFPQRELGLFQDRTNDEYGVNMYSNFNRDDTLKNKMFRNALDSVQLPKSNKMKLNNNAPMTGISNFDEFDNLF